MKFQAILIHPTIPWGGEPKSFWKPSWKFPDFTHPAHYILKLYPQNTNIQYGQLDDRNEKYLILGTPSIPKIDVFLEKVQMTFDPHPSPIFWNLLLRFFREFVNMHWFR